METIRLLRTGSPLFAAFISRFAPFRNACTRNPQWVTTNYDYALTILKTGVHDRWTGFTSAYFARPDEIVPLMESCGLETKELTGCEGIVARNETVVNILEGRDWETWVDLNYRLSKEPSLFGASDHLLYVGMKPL